MLPHSVGTSTRACVERINLTIRQQVAAVGRRVSTPVQGRGRVAAAVGRVPLLRQFLLAPRELTPAPAAAQPAHGSGSPKVAALHRPPWHWTDGSRLDAAGGVLFRVPRGRNRGGVRKPWWWEAAREGDLSGDDASAWPASRPSRAQRAAVMHDNPLF